MYDFSRIAQFFLDRLNCKYGSYHSRLHFVKANGGSTMLTPLVIFGIAASLVAGILVFDLYRRQIK